MSVQKVCRWIRMFREERRTNEARSSRPPVGFSDSFKNVQQLRDTLEEDRRMTISELWYSLQSPDCNRASVGRIFFSFFS